jgi:ferredoxin, 2Fe-2S
MTITIHFIAHDAASAEAATTLACKTGQSLMQAAIGANVKGIEADCGGLLTCGTCHVYVREPHAGQLPAPAADELEMLEFTASPRKPNSRLACQLTLTDALDGLTVDLPGSQH